MYSSQHPVYDGGKNTAAWSWVDDKIFEDALVKFPEGVVNRWEKIAGCLAGKSIDDVILHYEKLVYDVGQIESGLIEVPNYSELTETETRGGGMSSSSSGKRSQYERKKGKPWTVEEHMLFLRGLEIYGKSDWRSISRNVVISRLPSQVASHAQKYFNRLKSSKKERKRSSIHDITRVSDCITIAYPDINTNNNDNTSLAAAMDYYSNPNTNTLAAIDCYNNNNNNGSAGMNCYINNNNNMCAAVDYHINNNNNNNIESANINNNTVLDCLEWHGIYSESALDCLDLPEMSNVISVPAPANPPHIHECFPDFSYPF
ncbi:Duplicated homeodomain-like superfamily protein [Perilla frutescens var. frutescens]|nr:Duplicated homeodomain-like superfamily protein [Perilla frutescens var. frutescens]